MPTLSIRGISVEFPKNPYPCQIDYMEKVIEALETNKNALLESPTGTGKTLCLLCATLAWQKAKNENSPPTLNVEIHKPLSLNKHIVVTGSKSSPSCRSVIVYATRTHSQLAQVIDELRCTSYRPKMSVLGSREQLCIHEKVSKLKGSVLNHSCNTLNSRRGCLYKNNLDSFVDSSGGTGVNSNDILDIEDLTKIGQKKKICPYFFAREFSSSSEIVFMPYNYLLDESIRKTIRIPWENAIVIFDEAHNLERVASDAASFTITSADIASCIQELQQVVKALKEEYELKQPQRNKDASENDSSRGPTAAVDPTNPGGPQKPTLQSAVGLLKSMFALEKKLDEAQLYPLEAGQPPSVTLSGNWLVEAYVQAGFHNDLHASELKKCSNLLMDIAEEALNGVDEVLGGGSAPAHATEPKLNLFLQTLERILRCKGRSSIVDYKVYIAEEVVKKSNKINIAIQNLTQKKVVVNFWCFSTGVALTELTSLGIRSLLLTSGTLSPMEALKEDLKLPFPIELQNPHVINNNQICVAALASGVSGKSLNSSFANRDNTIYKDELGSTILAIYKKMNDIDHQTIASAKRASAKGGILVFFPSYAIMENAVERWKFTGTYDKLKTAIGYIIIEPKGKSTNKQSNSAAAKTNERRSTSYGFDNFNVVKSSKQKDPEDETFNGIIEEFDTAIARNGCCLLLAVCRGKVSEGIDFSDNKGRVVIVTGIPFAPFMDPWVMLKKQYLDEKSNPTAVVTNLNQPINLVDNNTSYNPWLKAQQQQGINVVPSNKSQQQRIASALTTSVSTKSTFTGQMWYNQSASRAVNQCLGRVIRHCKDWGAIFLLDERFLHQKQISELSKWMRPLVRKYNHFPDSLKAFAQFLTHATTNPALYYEPKLPQPPAESSSAMIKRVVSAANSKRIVQDSFGRTIEISESQLEQGSGEEERSYIQKELLATQSTPALKRNELEEFQDIMASRQKKMLQSSESKAMMNSNPQPVTVAPEEISLQLIIGKLKTRSNPSQTTSTMTMTSKTGNQEGKKDQKDIVVIDLEEDTNSNSAWNTNSFQNYRDDINLEDEGLDGPFSSPQRSASTTPFDQFSQSFNYNQKQFPSFVDNKNNISKNSILSQTQSFGLSTSNALTNESVIGSQTQELSQRLPMSSFQSSAITSSLTQSNKLSNTIPSLFKITQTLSLKGDQRAMVKNSIPLSSDDLKSILVSAGARSNYLPLLILFMIAKLKCYCHDIQIQEIKQLLFKVKEKKGIQFVSQIKEFQTALINIITRKIPDHKELTMDNIEEILHLFVIIIPASTTSSTNKGSFSLSSQQEQKTHEFLRDFYLNSVKQQMTHLLYQRKVDPMQDTNPKATSGVTSSRDLQSKNALLGPSSSTSSSSSSLGLLKRKYADVMGEEEISENVGSQRAKRLLQLNNQLSQPQKTSNTVDLLARIKSEHGTSSSTSTRKDLLDRIHNFSNFTVPNSISNNRTTSSQASSSSSGATSSNNRLHCCVCKDIATIPCASKCGHICCQSCWIKCLANNPICPMCRAEVTKETITKIVVKSKT